MNAEFLKLRILVAVQGLKISFYMKSSVYFSAPPQFQPVPLTSFALATAVRGAVPPLTAACAPPF